MNPLFIYLFSEFGVVDWLYDFVEIFSTDILGIISMPEAWIEVLTASIVLGLMWYITYFLYKRKVFISI